MAKRKNINKTIKDKARDFVLLAQKNGWPIKQAFIFGSHTKGTARSGSDIDICLVSSAFSNRFNDRLRLLRLRRQIDLAIEPHPFHPKDFINEDPLVWEIKKTGEKVKL